MQEGYARGRAPVAEWIAFVSSRLRSHHGEPQDVYRFDGTRYRLTSTR
jgi:hypothetical protein